MFLPKKGFNENYTSYEQIILLQQHFYDKTDLLIYFMILFFRRYCNKSSIRGCIKDGKKNPHKYNVFKIII